MEVVIILYRNKLDGHRSVTDLRDSLADISAARQSFGFEPNVEFYTGLSEYWSWIIEDPLSN